MLKLGKKGFTQYITWAIIGIIGLVILFEVMAELIPTAQTAGDALNATGVPLGGLFVGEGVVFVIVMAAALLAVVFFFLKKVHSK
jgi:uncharacterized membrane protein